MAQCKIHNIRFYNPEPQGIRCMKIQNSTKKLALCRTDATIEIWNLQETWLLERTLAPSTENFSVEDIVWCDNRLFSVGLHGLLIQYNLSKLCIENRWAVTGEAAHCLDINNTNSKIAIGTEQGYLNIFSVNKDGVYFEKFLDKQEGRIMCLKFDATGDFIASGSIDAIRIWNVQSGHAIHKMTTGRVETNKPTIVWCIDITDDFTVIAGDSRGKLSFWDGKVGSQIESYQSHKADILSITLSSDQSKLYCAGVDPTITTYQKVTIKGGTQKWVRSIQRKIHEHDVNSLVLLDNKLYSGGADSYLACSYHPPKTLLKLPPLLQNPCAHVASSSNYLLLKFPKHIELWSLGKSKNVDASFRGLIALKEEPKKLLELKRVTKNDDGEEDKEGIISCAISNNGKWIVYSTAKGVNLFQFIHDEETPNLIKVDDLENKDIPCLLVAFAPNNSQLIACQNTGNIVIYKLLDQRVSISQVIPCDEIFTCITFLLVSSCSKYIVVGDPDSNIVVFAWNAKKQEWMHHCKLPKYRCPPTAMAIHPSSTNLVVVYSDCKLIEYDIVKKHFTLFSRGFENSEWKSRPYPIRNIAFDPRRENIIMLQDDSNIIIINKDTTGKNQKETMEKNEKETTENKPKVPKKYSTDVIKKNDNDVPKNFNMNSIKKYKHLAHLEWLHEDELVVIEVHPLNIITQLPPAFEQHKFGKK
ncbi:U3 small nucleolar RNA-associated protein 4 homolog [Diabrotica virgifera virgifera]|uniref:Anaphase-promoting complex subunit 4-like WD40 domain-containing protein n=1 Tax=Diabrotica virgifera virgifera TaxID=50390 RepID=A0ABM5IDX7_DIAVI|nr:U3 small nucleolar RNA-associated protein 4 homolog [Diabrotica virgifera virgifera]